MKKRARSQLPRRLVVLLAAYGCFFLVVICTELGSTLGDSGDGRTRPCQQGFSLLRKKQKDMGQFRAEQLESKAFKRHVQEVFRPQPHHIEKYVVKHNWEAYDGSQEPYSTNTDVVMLIQSSPDRLPFVRQLAERWQGPISLAIYIPAPAPSEDAVRCNHTARSYLLQDHKVNAEYPFAVSFMYANGPVPNLGCSVHAHSTGFEDPVVDQVAFDRRFQSGPHHKATWESVLPAEYPVNALRTLAKDMVESNVFVFLGEADFMPTHSMHKKLRRGGTGTLLSEARHAWQSLGERRAIIVPAFEHLSHDAIREAQEAALNGTLDDTPVEPDVLGTQATSGADGETGSQKPKKQNYLALWGWGQSAACEDHDGNAPVRLTSSCWTYEGYSLPLTKPTLRAMVENGTVSVFHEASFRAGHKCYDPTYWLDHDEPYEVTVRNPCEPYFVALRDTLPHFDQRFRGRLRDKVSILTQMTARGTRFFVAPDQFITHLPHQPAVPLATLAHDATVVKYAFVVPHVLTQIMLEDMKAMSQLMTAVQHDVPDVGLVEVTPDSHSHVIVPYPPEPSGPGSTLGSQPPPDSRDSAAGTVHHDDSVPTVASEDPGSLRAGGLTTPQAKPQSNPLLLGFQYFSWDHVHSRASELSSDPSSSSNSHSSSISLSNNASSDHSNSTLSSRISNSSNSVPVSSSDGHWEFRVAPQKEAHAMPARSWMQELRGHFRRGGAAIWGSEVEGALLEGWKGFSDLSMHPECEVDWLGTAFATLALCCALGIMTWGVLRTQR